VFAVVINQFQSSQLAILSVIVFFVVGGLLLMGVDMEEGERTARAAEASVRAVS
jgi:MFS-type transporter involved in bile tolerance (Atg22 family)